MYRKLVATLVLLVLCAIAPGAHAQLAWPTSLIRVISPYPPGGENDSAARVVAQQLSLALGKPVIVEAKPGASTRIGSEFVAKSPPDGYTLLFAGAPHTTNPALFGTLPYDTVKDFAPIVRTVMYPVALAVPTSSPWRTAQEFLESARANPQTITIASSGNGTGPHLAIELLAATAGISLVHVPYKGVSPAVTDLVSTHVNAGIIGLGNLLPFVNSGKLRVLAVVSPQRVKELPSVPTMAEIGYPQVDASVWFGFLAPAGTPPEIVDRLNSEINRILKSPEVVKRFNASGAIALGGSPQDFDRFIRQDIERWSRIIRERGITVD